MLDLVMTVNPQVTLATAIDLLSGLGLSCVVPSYGRSVYAPAELRRCFVLETGRTFGILQIYPEPESVGCGNHF